MALSTLRGVLDEQRRFDADHFVLSSAGAVSLDLDSVAVDLEAFLREAAAGLALHDEGLAEQAHAHLSAAETAYAGDLLEEDLYEDWAGRGARAGARPLRPRGACPAADAPPATTTARCASRCACSNATPTTRTPTSRWCSRSSTRPPREARRAFRVYRGRMDEVGVEPPRSRPRRLLRRFEPATASIAAMETFLVRVWVLSEPIEL